MPRKIFVAGEILTAADLQANAVDQSVMVFDDSAARGSAIPTPSEGMVTYLSDVNALEVYTGAAFVPVPVGAGSVLQVVSTTKTDSFSMSSSAFADVTGLSATITPSSTSSDILVVANFLTGVADSGVVTRVNLLRDSTNIAQSTGSGTGDQTFTPFGASASTGQMVGISHLDSPATASAVTYKIQIASSTNGITSYVGRYAANDLFRSASFITLMEVAA
jgi:hypothetical protein